MITIESECFVKMIDENVNSNIIQPNPAHKFKPSTSNNTNKIHLPYYTANAVSQHNTQSNLYVTLYGNVLDLTQLIRYQQSIPNNIYIHHTYLLIKYAGTDISHWFNQDPVTHHISCITHIDPLTHLCVPYQPLGSICHISPMAPVTDYDMTYGNANNIEWYNDPQYIIGRLTKQSRIIQITNTLTSTSDAIEVCNENTISEIMLQYKIYNNSCAQYTWKYHGTLLDYDKTLSENGIDDETELMSTLNMNSALYIPELHIYYNDNTDII